MLAIEKLLPIEWYLAGPMSGYPDFNFPAFTIAATALRGAFGLTVRSAHEVDHGVHTGAGTQPWADYMRGDVKVLLDCGGIILLRGWPESKGASAEFSMAQALGIPIMQFHVGDGTSGSWLFPLSRMKEFSNGE